MHTKNLPKQSSLPWLNRQCLHSPRAITLVWTSESPLMCITAQSVTVKTTVIKGRNRFNEQLKRLKDMRYGCNNARHWWFIRSILMPIKQSFSHDRSPPTKLYNEIAGMAMSTKIGLSKDASKPWTTASPLCFFEYLTQCADCVEGQT